MEVLAEVVVQSDDDDMSNLSIPIATVANEELSTETRPMETEEDDDTISEEEEEDEIKGDDDLSYQPSISSEIRASNLKESRSRNRRTTAKNPTLPPPLQKKDQKKSMSDQKITEFCNKHLDILGNGNRLYDYVTALMACTISNEATVWQTWMTPLLFCCSVMDLDVYDWIQSSIGIPFVCVPPNALSDNGWVLPKVPNLPKHMKALLRNAHTKMTTIWNERSIELKQTYMVNNQLLNEIPPPMNFKAMQQRINFARKPIHRLIYSWPESETRDVRGDVLRWMVETLSQVRETKKFNSIVEDKVRAGMRIKMELAGQTTIPDYYKPITDTARKATKHGKKQTKITDTKKPTHKNKLPPISDTEATAEDITMKTRSATKKAGDVISDELTKVSDDDENHPVDTDGPKNAKRELDVPANSAPPNKKVTKLSTMSILENTAYEALGSAKDSGLMVLLQLWKIHCQVSKRIDLIKFAMCGIIKALMGKSMESIWRNHHECKGLEKINRETFDPPKPKRTEKGSTVEYGPPGENFVLVSNDLIQMMHVCIVATYVHGVGPTRWHWESNLLNGLRLHGPVTRHVREVAMLVCLILSAATPDEVCIAATVSLFAAGLLDLHSLKKASKTEIMKCIGRAGIGNKRCEFLWSLANRILEHHGGCVPSTLEELLLFDGVGRKTAVLAMNEIFGLTSGIGVDTHVMEVSKALGFIVPPDHIVLNADHVERSLTQWVAVEDCRNYNPIVGSFAQLFVRQLSSTALMDRTANHMASLVTLAASDHIHKPYHVELLWFAIARVRNHYKS